MKILFVNDKFLPEKTIVGRIIYENAIVLKKLGYKIFILTTAEGLGLLEIKEENFNGFTIFKTGRLPDGILRYYPVLYSYRLNKLFSKLLDEVKPGIVHFHNVHQNLNFSLFKCAKRYTDEVFLTAHDVQLFHYGKLIEFVNPRDFSCPKIFNYKISWLRQILRFRKRFIPIRRLVIRHYLKYIDKIFAVSGALKDALAQNGIKNVEVIHNGINADEWMVGTNLVNDFKDKYNLSGKKIILFGGRLAEFKGGKQIILAMFEVIKEVENATLVVMGHRDGYANSIMDMAVQKGLGQNIVFTGWLSGDDLKAAFHAADIVTTPSVCFDSFPTINLEAMACKKPVIATCFGGSKEVVLDGQTGYIVNPYNTNELAEKIIDLLVNPEKAEAFGLAGYERVKNEFSLERQVKKTMEWYQRMPSDKRPG